MCLPVKRFTKTIDGGIKSIQVQKSRKTRFTKQTFYFLIKTKAFTRKFNDFTSAESILRRNKVNIFRQTTSINAEWITDFGKIQQVLVLIQKELVIESSVYHT